MLRRYADHFNTQTIKQYLAGDRKVRQWVIMAARELGLTPTTEGGSNFTMNLTLAQDGYAGLEHSLPISPFYRDVVQLGAFSGMVYTPTFIVAYGGPSGRQLYLTSVSVDEAERLRYFTPHDELDKWKTTTWYRTDQYPHFLHAEQLKKWMDAGGQAGLGSHGEVQGLGTPLGALDDGVRGHGEPRRPAHGHAHERRRDRARGRHRLHRGRKAPPIFSTEFEPARRLAQHDQHRIRDEERPPLRGRDPHRGVAATASPAHPVVVAGGAAGRRTADEAAAVAG